MYKTEKIDFELGVVVEDAKCFVFRNRQSSQNKATADTDNWQTIYLTQFFSPCKLWISIYQKKECARILL